MAHEAIAECVTRGDNRVYTPFDVFCNCCAASVASEQQHKQDLRKIYRRATFNQSALRHEELEDFTTDVTPPSRLPFRVDLWDFSGGVCSGLPVKLGYLKYSNAEAYAPAWNIWAINCGTLILNLVIHFLAVSPPVVESLNEEKSSLLKLVE